MTEDANPGPWRLDYGNDVGPDDGYYVEWDEVTDGNRKFQCHQEGDAEWLMRQLNATAWVPCSERMPPENTPVLVWDANPPAEDCSQFVVASWSMFKDGPGWGECLNTEYRLWHVTHWMPLPPAPAE